MNGPRAGAPCWRIGAWTFDPATRHLSRDGRDEALPLKVAEVLGLLVRSAGQVVTRDTLIAEVWAGNQYTGPRGLTNAIWLLRRLFDGDADSDSAIETIAKSGYRLRLAVQPIAAEPPPAPPPAPAAVAAPRRWPLLAAAAGGVLLLAVLALFGLRAQRVPAELTARPEPLTMFDGLEEYPAISNDGRWLAFTWEREEHPSQIYARDLLHPDAPLRQLSLGDRSEVRAVWSPDAARIAFASLTPEGGCTVMIRDVNTYQQNAVAPCFYERLHQVFDWSPDGATMAIARQDPESGAVAIHLHPLQGGAERRLTHPSQGAQDSQLAWSHDGRRVAFVRRNADAGELYVVDLEGRERQLTTDGSGIYGLTWLSGDAELVFSSMRDGNFALWRIPATGGTPRLYSRLEWPFNMTAIPGQPGAIAVSQHKSLEHLEVRSLADGALISDLRSGGRDLFAQWSPALNRLIFVSTRGGRYEPWTSDPAGNEARRLTVPQGSLGLPAWSPLDARYAITLRPSGQAHDQIYIGDAAGDSLRQAVHDEHDYQNVNWEPGGRSLLVGSNRGGGWELWRYDIDSGAFEQLTRAGGEYGQVVGPWLYHSRHGMAGLWRLRPGDAAPQAVVPDLAVDDWGNWRIVGSMLYYVARTPQYDQVRSRDLDSGAERVILSLPGNSIRYYNSFSVTADGRMVLTVLGRRQADIVALRPQA